MDQIQGVMNIMELEACDFVQYLPVKGEASEELHVVSVRRDARYWSRDLKPKLLAFYSNVYLPKLVQKLNGNIAEVPMDL